MISIALFEPDIPQNTGTILRLAACFNIVVHIIEPCGFIFGGKEMKRAGMDYLNTVKYTLHASWKNFLDVVNVNDIVLASTKSNHIYYNFNYPANTCLLFGSESKGVTDAVRSVITKSIKIPMVSSTRSLNLAISCGIILSEAMRQNNYFGLK